MSDTDDTDLLLLIPPDFFLVQSPDIDDLDSICDISIPIENEDFKDSIVSDLISQVNDLESRICMIESLERSGTHCSIRNEESLIDQSINSLTESDLLRVDPKGKLTTVGCDVVSQHKPLSLENLDIANTNSHFSNRPTQAHFSDLPDTESINSIKLGLQRPDINVTFNQSSNLYLNHKHIETNTSPSDPSSFQSQLLREVDTYIGTKKGNTLDRFVYSDTKENLKEDTLVTVFQQKALLDLNCEKEDCASIENTNTEDCFANQSLELSQVHKLLLEMEKSQREIEKKLTPKEAMPLSSDLVTKRDSTILSGDISKRSYGIRTTLQGLGVDNFQSTTSSNPADFNSETQTFIERLGLQNMEQRLGKSDFRKFKLRDSFEGNYLNTPPATVLSEELKCFQNESGRQNLVCSSPRKLPGSCYPVDLKPNLPKNERKGILERDETKVSPRKRQSFKNFLKQETSIYEDASHLKTTSSNRDGLMWQPLNRPNKLKNNEPMSGKPTGEKENNIQEYFSVDDNTKFQHTQQVNNQLISHHVPSTEIGTKQSSCDALNHKSSVNNLLSLSELWNNEPTFHSDDPNKLRQKLEEEKYRRQHCEQLIQVLQQRVLEEQEKLAVAIRVDQEKDKAIVEISESWRKLNNHWHDLEEQRHSLAQQLQEEKAMSKSNNIEMTKKIERWEKEVGQALDLAADYKEKCEATQKQMDVLKVDKEGKLQELTLQLADLKEENIKINSEKQDLLSQLKTFQERITEEAELLIRLKTELEKSKQKISDYEAEVNILKEQKESILIMIKDEKSRSNILEQENGLLQQALEEASKKEKAAQEEAKMSRERIDVARTELRALYQGQLETVVKEKLQEFQTQLEAAETALNTELSLKEKQWAEKAEDQCKKLQEKYKIDRHRLEESYKEEVSKWKARLYEREKQKAAIESRLQDETRRRADMAQRLHNVMETNWREALNVISNPIQGSYEVEKDENPNRRPSSQQSFDKMKGAGDMRVSQSGSNISSGQVEDVPFCKDGLITSRETQPSDDQQLKKYIQMVLERGISSFQSDTLQDSLDQTFTTENSFVDTKWIQDGTKTLGRNEKFGSLGKPPWK